MRLYTPVALAAVTIMSVSRPVGGLETVRSAGSTQAAVKPAQATVASLTWLAGNWEGRQGAAVIEERWTPPGGGAMLGVSRTLRDGRMVAFEFLRIVERDGTLVYVAQPGGRPPTEFTLTRVGPTEAVFENPMHDYPQVITYTMTADRTLTASTTARDGSKPQRFVFRPQ
jgi:hypothetical protein